jgi:acyl-CoA synthetase (AMP-forming)/AMP-acid ligase II/predicted NAD/FAD-binding protein/thioesterase domain-containing protein/acyl carrier protein
MPTDDDDAEIAKILPQWTAQVKDYRAPAGARAPTGPLRGGHPKSHGIVRGTLALHAVAAELRVGLFAAPRVFPCRARFSNVQGGAFSDARDLRGLAVKLLDDAEEHTLHDLLCSSVEVLPHTSFRDLTPARFLEPMEALLARDPSHPDAPRLDTNLLTARYFSVTAYAFGRDRACKYALFPHADSAAAATLDPGGADDLAASLAHNLASRPWRFSLCVQLAEGPEHSVDDVTRRWAAPWREVGTLTLHPQAVPSPADDPLERRFYTSPAHCHPDHQPVGSMARVRLAVYAASRAARGAHEVAFPFRPWRQRVAVVGGGAAGLAAAASLVDRGHEVVVYEASDRLGGHAVSVRVGERSVDPGFGVFTPHTHPNLMRLCARWSLPVEALARFDEARSWRTPDGDTSYARFADIPFAREVLAEAAVFQREELPRLLRDPAWDEVTVGEYLQRRSHSRDFVRYYLFGQVVYLFPGHPEAYYLAMPLRPLLRHAFDLARHGEQPLLRMKHGSGAYIATLAEALRERGVTFRTRAEVAVLARDRTGVDLRVDGARARFDHLVLAVAPHRALRVLGEAATPDERRVLGSVGHTVNAPVAHLDPAFLPRDASHHAYHNMVVAPPVAPDAPRTLAATKRAPCNLDGATPCLVTHDYAPAAARPSGPSVRVAFEHVDVDRATFAARAALPALQGVARAWFAGAWTRGLTWHDDAIASGIVAANGIVTPLEADAVLCSYATAPDRRDERPLPLAAFQQVLATLPDKEFLAFVDERGEVAERHTPRSFDARTRRLARALTGPWGARPGDRVILAHPPGLGFFEAFVACLRAGIIPVPVYPPVPGSSAGNLAAFAHIVRDADARLGLCPAPYDLVLPGYLAEALRPTEAASLPPDLRWRADTGPDVDALDPAPWRDAPGSADEVAFLQYTSGSTGDPRGVMISHGNLAHQAHAVCAGALGLGPESVCVSWLPMYHDFALISGLLLSFQLGLRNVFIAPQSFAARPALWMETCHRERATATAAPDFAYALIVRRTTPEERAGWDLSRLAVVMSAAEPVRPATVDAFLKAFRASRLAPRAFCPAYGLAEHTVGVTVGGRRLAHFDRAALAAERVARPGELALVGNGPAPPGVDVRIVDPATRVERALGEVGEVWVDSPSKALGYWGRPETSAERFEARIEGSDGSRAYLRTGDVGFLWEGELFVTGRLKDVIVVRGRNHAAPDLERALDGAHAALRPGGLVALQDPLDDTVLVVAELARADSAAEGSVIARALRAALAREAGLAIGTVALVPPRSLPRTTSGKLQRSRARELFSADALPVIFRCERDPGAAPEAAPAIPAPVRATLSESAALDALTRIVAESARLRLDPDEELGGAVHLDSLQVVEIAVAVERALGRAVTGTDLRRFNTLRALARHLAGVAAPSARLRLLAGPPEPAPVFLSGPMFLRARDLHELGAALGRGRRVYALERDGETLAEVVAAQVEAVRETLDRAARCHFVGSSFGGLVAHAVAAELERRGVEVPRMVMFDTYHPDGYVAAERPPVGGELSYVAALLAASLRTALPPDAVADPSVAILHLLRPYRRAVDPDADAGSLRRDLERHARWMHEAAELYRSQPPRLVATELVYFQATDRPAGNRNVVAWSALHRAVEVHPSEGDHFSVLRAAPRLVEATLPRLRALDLAG